MKSQKLLIILTCIFLPLFIILSSYQLSLKFIDKTIAQEQTINLIREWRSEQLIISPLNYTYTNLEISHLKDVEKVMAWADSLWLFSVIAPLMLLAFYFSHRNKLLIWKQLYYGSLTTIILLSVTLFSSIFLFQILFTIFHLIFFPQGNWIFPMESLLIRTFPQKFFQDIALFIFSISLTFGIILYLIARNKLKK
ncbi:DUF1461 domain-containing protein [Candidatus Woesearchaeota archaeon]|nr:DUF1461 domain-containing protein [Candidatus Woesearchaeota archaeon]